MNNVSSLCSRLISAACLAALLLANFSLPPAAGRTLQLDNLQWTPTAGPGGGDVPVLLASGPMLLAGTSGGGVFRSADNGQTWVPTGGGLNNQLVRALAVGRNGFWYAGTDGGGVFRSTDDGQTWVRVNNGLSNLNVLALAVGEAGLFAGTRDRIFRSTDNGATWTQMSVGLIPATVVNALLVNGATILAGTSGGVFRSTDNGAAWVDTNLRNLNVLSFAQSGANLYAGTGGSGVYRSSNDGVNWNVTIGAPANRNVLALAVNGANLFAGTSGGGVFLTSDNGLNWAAINNGLSARVVNALAVSGSALVAGTAVGVFRSPDNGQNWTLANQGLSATIVRALAVSGANLFAGTAANGVFRSSDGGRNWAVVNNGLLNLAVNALLVSGTRLFAGTDGGTFLSIDNGQSWRMVNTLKVFALAQRATVLFAGTDNPNANVFRSTDGGNIWDQAPGSISAQAVFSFGVNGLNLFAGTNRQGVFRTGNDGNSWAAVSNGLSGEDNRTVNVFVLSGPTLFAGTRGGVFRSSNSNDAISDLVSWGAVNTGLPISRVVKTLALNGTELFAGLEAGGVYRTADNGLSWAAANNGLFNNVVNALAVSGTSLFAGTSGNGVFTASLVGCTYAIAPDNQSFPVGGGSGTVNVTAPTGCAWTAASRASWLTINEGASGGGNGIVRYTVEANPGVNARSGTLFIAGQEFTVMQAGVPLNPVPTVTALNPNATTAGGPAFTLTVSGTNFIGGSTVRWNNSDRPTTFINPTQLTAQITTSDIAAAVPAAVTVFNPAPGGGLSNALTFTINPLCTYALDPAGRSFPAGGGTGSVNVLTAAGCAWTATSNDDWLRLTGVAPGNGPGTINYSVLANAGANQRSGTLTVAGRTFTVTQAGVAPNPVPQLAGLNPNAAPAGGAGFTLTVSGANLLSDAVVRWNGGDRATTFVDATRLTAQIPASDLAEPGLATVTVFNPPSSGGGGGLSNALTFTVTPPPPPLPTLTSINPNQAPAGGANLTLTVNGANFTPGARVRWNDADRLTNFINATQLLAEVTAGDLAQPGTVRVTVFNPPASGGGGGTSNALTFTVTPPLRPAPVLVGLSPNQAPAGGAAFTLLVNGANFTLDAVVRWRGGDRATTFVSAAQLTARILAADVAMAGAADVQVFTPAPGGGLSNALIFTINPPANPLPMLTSLEPPSRPAGGPDFTLTINGTGFINASQVLWNDGARLTVYLDPTRLSINVTAGEITRPGTATLRVSNPAPGGGLSNALTFTIALPSTPVPTLTGLNPTARAAGTVGFTLTVTGAGFVAGSKVRWNGGERATDFSSETELRAEIPAGDLSAPAAVSVTVFNPPSTSGGGGISNALLFTVTPPPNPVPAAIDLSPNRTGAGGAGFTLTLLGVNFISNSVVRWNGSDRITTFISATRLTAEITAADIAAAGTASLTVFNPASAGGGGGLSSALPFTISGGNTIAGRVGYWNGDRPVAGTTLTATALASGAMVATATGGADGRYSVGGLVNGAYLLRPTKLDEVNGLTAFDAARVAQHLTNVNRLVGFQLVAGDVNGDSLLTAEDALAIAQTAVGLPGAGRWTFVPPFLTYESLTGNQVNQNFTAVLLGDVTGNWLPAPPTITAVEPMRDEAGRRALLVRGTGFEPGLSLIVIFPAGGELRLDGAGVTATSFAARWSLTGGPWVLRVVNADGRQSEPFAVSYGSLNWR